MFQAKIYKFVGLLAGGVLLGALANFSLTLVLGVLCLLALTAFFYFRTQTAFYVLLAYLPFQLALNLSPGVDLLSGRVLILLLAAVWLVKSLKEKKFSWPKDRTTWALLLFFCLALISLFVAQNQIFALRKLLVFISVFPLFFLAKALVQDIEQLKKVVWIVIASALTSAVVALAQFGSQFVFGADAVFKFWAKNVVPLFLGNSFGAAVLQNPSWFVQIGGRTLFRAIGLFPDPHMLAFFLGMASTLNLALLFCGQGRKKLLFGVFLILMTALFLTFSRGGYVGAAAGLLVTGVLLWRRLDAKAKTFAVGFFCILVALASLTPVFGRFFSSFDLAEGSNAGRLTIWAQSLDVSKNNLLLGVGLGNYPLALNFNEDYRSAVTSHNLYLDILAETGIFGLLSWLLFWGSAAADFLKKAKHSSLFISAVAAGLVGSLVYFASHSFFETAIFNPTILAVFVLLAGLGNGLAEIRK